MRCVRAGLGWGIFASKGGMRREYGMVQWPLSRGRRVGATKNWLDAMGVGGRGEKRTRLKQIFPVAADETPMNKERIKMRKTIPLNLL